MLHKLYTLGFAALATAAASAQSSPLEFNSGPDYIAWPTDTPIGCTKVEGGNITPDQIGDAVALKGGDMYLIHAPAHFPRWQLVASSVFDFEVVHSASAVNPDRVFYTDPTGLHYMTWGNNNAPVITDIAGTSSWAGGTRLCGCALNDGTTTVACVGSPGKVILRVSLSSSGVWSTLTTISETAAITSLAVADFATNAGVEVADVAASALHIRTADTATLSVGTIANPVAHKVFRIDGGGANGLDGLGYVAASNSSAQEALCEIFPGGASAVVETQPWTVGEVRVSHPWGPGAVCVTLLSGNSPELFRLQAFGSTPGSPVFVLPTTDKSHMQYFHIQLSAPDSSSGTQPITDGHIACGDFDGDGFDDVLLLSNVQKHSYVYPAVDDVNRLSALPYTQVAAFVSPTGGTVNGGTPYSITINFTGITSPWNGMKYTLWTRSAGTGTNPFGATIDTPALVDSATQLSPDASGNCSMTINFTSTYSPGSVIFYIELRTAVYSSGVITSQLGTPLDVVAMQYPGYDARLCTLFTSEPDRYTDANQRQNACTSGVNSFVILNGFNRRSAIGPIQSGSGSPTGH